MNMEDINKWKKMVEEIIPQKLKSYPFTGSSPRKFSDEIKDIREKALQRAIIQSSHSKLSDNIYTWLDIELPVGQEKIEDKNSNRFRIDLIGKANNNKFAIVELKYGNSKDSPEEGTYQLLNYFYNIILNKEILDEKEVYHHNRKKEWLWSDLNFDNVELILAGDKVYWNKYSNEKRLVFNLGELFPKVCYYSININNINYFSEQSKGQKYTPKLTENENIWEEIDMNRFNP